MNITSKLYKVTLRGLTYNSTGVAHGVSYVIAESTDKAYNKMRDYLDSQQIGFKREGELDTVQLIADSYPYNDTGTMLYL